MKRSSIMAILCLPILLLACGNPNQTGSDEHEENPIQEADADMQTLESAKSFLMVKTVITKSESSINLPSSVAGYEGVTVSWSSGDESVISINGTVAHQSGTGSDTVNLTATLSLNGKTATKVFEITVYQTNAKLSDEEVLEAAASDLETDASELYAEYLNADILSPYTLTLNDSVVIDGNEVSVNWSAESEDDHFSLSGNNLTIERDIVDIPVSLKGILTYNGETCEKTITFAIPCISEFICTHSNSYGEDIETYSFDGNKLGIMVNYTHIENGGTVEEGEYGEIYSYAVNSSTKTITLSKIKFLNDGTWYTKSEYRDYLTQYNVAYGNAMKRVDANPTLANLAEYMEHRAEDDVLEFLKHEGYYSGESSVEDAVRAYMDDEIEEMRWELNLSNTATHSQIIDAYVFQEIEEELEEDFPGTIVYDYQIDFNDHGDSNKSWKNNVSFSAKVAFLAGKHWYEQTGDWETTDGVTHAGLWCYCPIKERRGAFDSVNVDGRAKFSEDFMSFVLRPISNSGTISENDKQWSITEDLTNKKITVSNGHGKTYDLFFDPMKLH